MPNTNKFRSETDSMGELKVPQEAYFGAFTVRAAENFQISDLKAASFFKTALALVKLSAAQTNCKLRIITKKQETAIIKAAQEFIAGKFDQDFTLDIFQAGAGTSYNMNINEILANRANEILGGKKGTYEFVHPNDHVNQSQSTNDVIPTASRVAALLAISGLLKELKTTTNEFAKIAKKESKTLKVGRTHLQDAVPITLGQEFDSYKEALTKTATMIELLKKDLHILGIGGTAVGTGINTDPSYQKSIVQNLAKNSKLKLIPGKNLTELANNMNSFVGLSSSLRALAINLLNISGDLKMMNMGPKAGLMEITLPPVQPGSSIMPGKVNPSILEALDMICFQVIGADHTIELAAARSQFDLNVYCPIIIHNLLTQIQILTNGLKMLREKALQKLEINRSHIKKTFEESLCTGTALAPYIGYNQTADVIKTALKKGTTIRAEILNRKLLDAKKLDLILSAEATTKPSKKKF